MLDVPVGMVLITTVVVLGAEVQPVAVTVAVTL
jgi:hypothetical protein